MNDVRAFFSLFFPFRLLFGDPPVSSGRFLASFPFEPASNLTPAFPAVRRRLAFRIVPFPFRVLFTLPFPFIFPFRLLFGDPPVSSGRFLASFPFEPASNLTPAFPAVFPGSVVALLFVSCLFLFESSSRFLFLSFFLFGSHFLFLHFSFSAPLRRAAGLLGSSSETRRSRPDGFW